MKGKSVLTMSSIASLRAVNVSTTTKGTAVVTGVKEDMKGII